MSDPPVPESFWYVSPHHTVADLVRADFETNLAIVDAQFRGWIFVHAQHLRTEAYPHRQHSAFAILTLMTPYFEAIAEFLNGEDSVDQSCVFFRQGFRAVFAEMVQTLAAQGRPETVMDVVADAVYEEVRCGLFHSATTRSRVRVTWGLGSAAGSTARAFSIQMRTAASGGDRVEWIMVNADAFRQSIENHFSEYLAMLRSAAPDSDVRERFGRAFNRRLGLSPRNLEGPLAKRRTRLTKKERRAARLNASASE